MKAYSAPEHALVAAPPRYDVSTFFCANDQILTDVSL